MTPQEVGIAHKTTEIAFGAGKGQRYSAIVHPPPRECEF
jgi:hypothetical protein